MKDLPRRLMMDFHKYMITNRWTLHSSGNYYYKDGDSWPPKQEDMCGVDEIFDRYLEDS